MRSRIADLAIPEMRCATMAEPDQDTEVILFEHKFFHGKHKHVFGPDGEKDLNARDDHEFFDPARGVGRTSSIVIKGTKSWLFFPRQDFEVGDPPNDKPIEVGPGVYETTQAANPKLKDNRIQSLRPK
jgi:hypothetical protein